MVRSWPCSMGEGSSHMACLPVDSHLLCSTTTSFFPFAWARYFCFFGWKNTKYRRVLKTQKQQKSKQWYGQKIQQERTFLRYMQVFPSPVRRTERGHDPFLPFSVKSPYREGGLSCALSLFYPFVDSRWVFFEQTLVITIFVLSSFWVQCPKSFLSLDEEEKRRERRSESGQNELGSVKKTIPYYPFVCRFKMTLLLPLLPSFLSIPRFLCWCVYACLFVVDEMKVFCGKGIGMNTARGHEKGAPNSIPQDAFSVTPLPSSAYNFLSTKTSSLSLSSLQQCPTAAKEVFLHCGNSCSVSPFLRWDTPLPLSQRIALKFLANLISLLKGRPISFPILFTFSMALKNKQTKSNKWMNVCMLKNIIYLALKTVKDCSWYFSFLMWSVNNVELWRNERPGEKCVGILFINARKRQGRLRCSTTLNEDTHTQRDGEVSEAWWKAETMKCGEENTKGWIPSRKRMFLCFCA